MYISARERKILDILLSKNDETTVKHLAEELDVSVRTVHRDLKGVEEILKDYKLGLNKKSGFGIQVKGEKERIEKLKLFLFNLSHNEYTPEERQSIILSELLDVKEPVKLLSLANDLNVTIATISNDLNKVEERLTPFKLNLIRKRGYGVEIIGSESAKRKAMSRLIIENIDEFEFMSIIKESIQKRSSQNVDTITDRLLGLVDKKKLITIENQIDKIKPELPYTIADSAYIGLVVHLALAIERIQQGEEINFDLDYLESIKGTKEFKVAEKVVSGLEEAFRISISHGEIGYITMHLMGAKIRNEQDDIFEEPSLQMGLVAQKLIKKVSNKTGQDLTKNMSLFQGLVAHLRPALYRMKQNMGISNPLLSRIETDYKELFQILEEAVRDVFPDLFVPREEIGYLVMHFASALLKGGSIQEQKVLIVCSSGIGTSKMLSTKLEKEVAGITTVNASMFDLETMDPKNYDAIISTIPLNNYEEDYLVVNPLLLPEDITKVKKFLFEKQGSDTEQLTGTNQQKSKTKTHGKEEFLSKVLINKNYASSIYHLLKGFQVNTLHHKVTKEQLLTDVCKKLKDEHIISDLTVVLDELDVREGKGGMGIPGTTLALFHTRSDQIKVPSVTITRLDSPLTVKAMDGSTINMNTLILMLAPMEVDEETLDVLSTISSIIIRDEESIQRFERAEEKVLVDFFTTEMQELYEEKVKK